LIEETVSLSLKFRDSIRVTSPEVRPNAVGLYSSSFILRLERQSYGRSPRAQTPFHHCGAVKEWQVALSDRILWIRSETR